MIIIDLEIITLVCLIIILIYNYCTNDCYTLFKYKKKSSSKACARHLNNNIYTAYEYDNFVNSKRQPDIELESFANDSSIKNIESDTQKLPDNVYLNDRYNDFITPYTDDQLTNIISEVPSDLSDIEYTDTLVDDLQKNIIFDMDKKLSDKSKSTQRLAKDSATIASNFGRNSLLESYKNELDEYEKERTPWWAESDNY